MSKQLEPSNEHGAEDAPGTVADLVKEDPNSTWEAIVRRNPAAVPQWASTQAEQAPTTKG
jgi:hypothetical protein